MIVAYKDSTVYLENPICIYCYARKSGIKRRGKHVI